MDAHARWNRGGPDVRPPSRRAGDRPELGRSVRARCPQARERLRPRPGRQGRAGDEVSVPGASLLVERGKLPRVPERLLDLATPLELEQRVKRRAVSSTVDRDVHTADSFPSGWLY